MAGRESEEHRTPERQREEDHGADVSQPEGGERREKIDADVDALLDEIDEVLEENAEEFVRGFVQKGGQ